MNKAPDWKLLCPVCFGAGEVTFEDQRYGVGFGRFHSSIPCACVPIREPIEYALREVRQRLAAEAEAAEAYIASRTDLEDER